MNNFSPNLDNITDPQERSEVKTKLAELGLQIDESQESDRNFLEFVLYVKYLADELRKYIKSTTGHDAPSPLMSTISVPNPESSGEIPALDLIQPQVLRKWVELADLTDEERSFANSLLELFLGDNPTLVNNKIIESEGNIELTESIIGKSEISIFSLGNRQFWEKIADSHDLFSNVISSFYLFLRSSVFGPLQQKMKEARDDFMKLGLPLNLNNNLDNKFIQFVLKLERYYTKLKNEYSLQSISSFDLLNDTPAAQVVKPTVLLYLAEYCELNTKSQRQLFEQIIRAYIESGTQGINQLISVESMDNIAQVARMVQDSVFFPKEPQLTSISDYSGGSDLFTTIIANFFATLDVAIAMYKPQ